MQDALTILADEMRRTTQMPLTQPLLQAAQEVIDTFQLRAGDAIQLASALAFIEAEPSAVTVLIASDTELLEAARQAGLETLNPAVS